MNMEMRARIGRLFFDVAGVQGQIALAREENDSPELVAAWERLQAALDALDEAPRSRWPIPPMPCRKCGGSYKE